MASFVDRPLRRVLSSRLLTLNGYVAFNLPRTVTALGGSLLAGLAAVHLYLLLTAHGRPRDGTARVGHARTRCPAAGVGPDRAKGGYCDSCGGTDFDVGAALYLGFLFLDEDDDAYMVALTCRSPDCAKRTGVVLAENEFLSDSRARIAV